MKTFNTFITEGVKSHFLYQDDVETRLGKTKRVLWRGTEKECKDKIFSWSRGFIHKGRDFSIWKGKFNKNRYFDPWQKIHGVSFRMSLL